MRRGRGDLIGDSDIKSQMQVLNDGYNAKGIQFRLVKTTRIESKDCSTTFEIVDFGCRHTNQNSFNLTIASQGTPSSLCGPEERQGDDPAQHGYDGVGLWLRLFIRLRADSTTEFEIILRTRSPGVLPRRMTEREGQLS
ncbi:hypothetical protein D9613_006349 [Agrocybe pediades]|uniref:Uncharacterized protein n=1 Tax=Agrocybe pediades TaxID=84607 RepID=A0A8H4VPC0_9AGAR|nr:hypothetical protein D9613_006349 [Agrocybe pediades]